MSEPAQKGADSAAARSRERAAQASRLQQVLRVLTENPFRILGLSPRASPREVEREGTKLLGLIAAGLDDRASMAPLGPKERGAEQVRWAVAELRDPHRRALHEFFWPACESLPVDAKALAELLDRLPQALPGGAPLAEVLQDLAGELIPEPPPFEVPPELSSRIDLLLAPRPPASRAPELCPDALDLPELFPLPLASDKDAGHGQG